MTEQDIEVQNQVYRGELRWRGDRWVESGPYDCVQHEDRARRMQDEVQLSDRVLELPNARDVIRNIGAVEIDRRKFQRVLDQPPAPRQRRQGRRLASPRLSTTPAPGRQPLQICVT